MSYNRGFCCLKAYFLLPLDEGCLFGTIFGRFCYMLKLYLYRLSALFSFIKVFAFKMRSIMKRTLSLRKKHKKYDNDSILPWQINNTFIIVIVCFFLPGNAQFCGCFRGIVVILFYISDRQIIA